MKYFEEARNLWKTYVPPRGQADTVQGELMRAVEKLRDEACRNGNINWRPDHQVLGEYLRDTLISSGVFDDTQRKQIEDDVALLLTYEEPVTEDEPFDRLTDRIVEWSRQHPEPVPRGRNPELEI